LALRRGAGRGKTGGLDEEKHEVLG